jgi:hypothetical protein
MSVSKETVMATSELYGFTPHPQPVTRLQHGQVERFDLFLDAATRWADEVGGRLGTIRQWMESEAIDKRPLTTLGIAFGLGVLTGWLIKRR